MFRLISIISGDARLDFILPKINALLIPGSPVGPGTLGYLFANGDNIDLPASFETTLKLAADSRLSVCRARSTRN